MIVPSYVPNDAYLRGGRDPEHRENSFLVESQSVSDHSDDLERPSMLLLTGPNYSGKSVYQKQVALAVYMAHVGSFVPAASATIGLTDKILTRITTRETVSKNQSAFMIDLQQIALALNQATNRSLIVIDEFGKGTDSCDGAGLAAGVLTYLLSLSRDAAPKVLAATHFHEIFSPGLFPLDHPSLAFAHMEVHIDGKGKRRQSDSQTEVTYLYNLRPGRSNLSYGTQCAAMNGIPPVIVKRAAELADLVTEGEDLVRICAGISPEEEEDLEDAEAAARAFLAEDFGPDGIGEMSVRDMLDSVLGESATGSVS